MAKFVKKMQLGEAMLKLKKSEFIGHFDNLFDTSHFHAMDMINNDVDKQFLNYQRQNVRPGLLTGIDRTSYRKEKRNIYDLKKLKKEKNVLIARYKRYVRI